MMPPREIRLLKELIAHEKVTVRDLRQTIGALNPAQVKFQLTRRGWIIQTGFITVLDRDGKECHPGYYWMEPSERDRARRFLEELDRATLPALPANDVSEQRETTTTNDNSKGGGK